MVIKICLLLGFHPATRCTSTPADNTRKRVWQYIEKERKESEFEPIFAVPPSRQKVNLSQYLPYHRLGEQRYSF